MSLNAGEFVKLVEPEGEIPRDTEVVVYHKSEALEVVNVFLSDEDNRLYLIVE